MFEPVLMVFLVGVAGAIIGSFLNLCIYRVPRGKNIVWGSSYCTQCQYQLTAKDLVPILSYIGLKGRCRSCGQVIGIQYLLVELITVALFILAYLQSGISWPTLLMCILFAILICITFIDLEHQIIPDGLIVTGLVLGVPIIALISLNKLLLGIVGFLVAGLFFLLLAVVSKGGMGGGDIKLSALLGLYLGWPQILVALLLAFVAGGLFGLYWIVIKGGSRKDAVPFGPFLAFGAIIAVFYAPQIINWYWGLCM